jgi:tetratricopeptide (TPR) repeat protein
MPKSIKRKKITRHELKEDRFLETMKNFITFFRANTSRIVLTIFVILAVIVALRFYFSNKRTQEETAVIKKLYADALYENGNFKEAISAYQEIIQMHESTHSGKISFLFLANCYFFSGDMENAEEYYERALKALRKNPNWAGAAAMGIASIYEQDGKFSIAIERYSDIIENYKDTPVYVDALFAKARCFEFMNSYREAIDVYSVIESDFRETDFAREAERRIVFLRGAVESERVLKR